MTLWPYADHRRTADDDDAPLAAAALTSLHRAPRDYAGPLPAYTQTLDRCWTVLDVAGATTSTADDRKLLKAHYRRLRNHVEAAGAACWVPLHGDSHPGNLLIGEHGPIWVDFEEACRGPREHDIACLPSASWPLFEGADMALVKACSNLKSVCVAVWCAVDPSRSAAVQEAADYHLTEVRQWTG